jgi:hypothetical protein
VRHLALAITLLAPSAALAAPLYVGGRFGMLAMESGATTRSPAMEVALAARWAIAGGLAGPSLSYRGGWRSAGGDAVGMSTLVHRIQAGVFAQRAWKRTLAGAELGGHVRFESSRLQAGGEESAERFVQAWGVGADAWLGVRLLDELTASLVFGGYQRGELLDLTLGISLDLEL